MSRYLMIESRSPMESGDARYLYDLATGLASGGDEVSLFLVENGVMAARKGASAPGLDVAHDAGVRLMADRFALDERGISLDSLRNDVEAAELAFVVDMLADGAKVIWH